ncbi:MAG: potassium/proton antiporter [Streptosporangiales bacterium]|nr:potassium/proton antiporter [Streptosporangiales bacterium]
MSESVLPVALLIGAGVLLVCIFAVRLLGRIGLPGLLFFLALGLAIEPLGISISDPELAQMLGLGALVVILAEGGITTAWSRIRNAIPPAVALATVGVVVSMLVVAVVAHFIAAVPWRMALLLGAILSSTDAAAVFSVLRKLPLPPKLAGMLEAESGFNDAPGVILVVALSATGPPPGPWHLAGNMLLELAIGAALGLAAGWLGAKLVRRIALPASGLYPLTVLALTIGVFGLAAVLHGSGFLAVYLAGVVLGNARLPHGPATRGFAEGLALLAQIGLFVMLGITEFPERLPAAILPALLIGIGLLVARPVAVLASVVWFRLPWRELVFLSWAGLRGAVPIVLATIPASVGIPGADRLFDVVFVLVVIFTLLQAPTLPWVAKRLGIATPAEPHDLDVEAAPLTDMGADLLQLTVPKGSKLAGVELFELRLPEGAAITLIVRDGEGFVPAADTILRTGDELIVVTAVSARGATERRLRAVSRRGKLAGWFGERGEAR